MDIIEIEGIGPKYGEKLKDAGYEKIEELIPLSRKDLKELAEETGISFQLLDKWQEHADLMRIKGVGPEYSDALNQIGIDSVKEFAQRNPENTLKRIEELDKEKPDVIRRVPTLDAIKNWIKQAKKLK
jgi:predicted flap endonuclease-1-like 5' DNA nuclease